MREQRSRETLRAAASSSTSDKEIFREKSPSLEKSLGRDLGTSLPRVVVMIPCFNEEQTLASVIRSIPRELPRISDVKIVVIDDGSQDDTAIIAARVGADVLVRHKANLGLGQTFQDGLEASLRLGADIIVNVDADGQYPPSELMLLLDPILRGRADIVLGDRQIKQLNHMSWSRKRGNQIASWVTRRLSGTSVQDSQTGFRALTREAALRLRLNGDYTYTQEMVIQAAHKGLTIAEVPITFHRRSDGDSRLIRSLWSYAWRAGKIILRSYRDYKPLRAFTLLGGSILVLSGLLGVRVLLHFWTAGTVSPFFPSAILGGILGIVGIQIIIFGLLSDMIRSQRQELEDVLIRVRRAELDRSKTPKR